MKVFSVEKFKKNCKKIGLSNASVNKSCKIWANKCDGLTKEEMKNLWNCCTTDDWMVEKEENNLGGNV